MDSKFLTGNGASTAAGMQDVGGEGYGVANRGAYAGGEGYGKLRSSRRGSNRNATPYDRPSSGRHANLKPLPASVVDAASSSVTSRIVNSASRMITSSASYIFSSFFGRKPLPSITQGNLRSVEEEKSMDEDEAIESPAKEGFEEEEESVQDEEEDLNDRLVDQELTMNNRIGNQQLAMNDRNGNQQLAVNNRVGNQQLAVNDRIVNQQQSSDLEKRVTANVEKKGSELSRLEEILRLKTLSREEVNRLTNLLQSQVNGPANTPVQALQRPKPRVEREHCLTETPVRTIEDTAVPVSEAQRWREELKKARSDLTPIEVARAYMGERTSMPSGLTLNGRCPSQQIDKVAELQPPPGLGLIGDRYRTSPFTRSVNRSPVVRMAIRNSHVDEDWMSVGPVRRSRQRAFQMAASPSPYARPPAPRDSISSRSYATPPVQSSQTARKILDTLEKLTPPKGRSLDEEFAMERTPMPLSSDIFNSQARKCTRTAELSRFSNMRDPGVLNGRLDFGSVTKTPAKFPTFGTAKEGSAPENLQLDRRPPCFSDTCFGSSAVGVSSKFSEAPLTPILPSTYSANAFGVFGNPGALGVFGNPGSSTLSSLAACQSVTKTEISAAPSELQSKPAVPWGQNLSSFDSASAGNKLPMSSSSVSLTPEPTHAPTPPPASGGEIETKLSKDCDSFITAKGPSSFQFGSSSSGSTFSFKTGNESSMSCNAYTDSALSKGFPFGSQSVTSNASLFSFSKSAQPFTSASVGLFTNSMLTTSSSVDTTSGSAPANPLASASSSAPASLLATTSSAPMFGSPLNMFSSIKPVQTDNLFGTLQENNLKSVFPASTEATNASFTFPSSPVLCPAPSFSFDSGASSAAPTSASTFAGFSQASTSDKGTTSQFSPTDGSNSIPVFSFTSPTGGPKLPAESIGTLLPEPKFTFGSGASSSPSFSSLTSSFAFGGGQIGSSSSVQSSATLTSPLFSSPTSSFAFTPSANFSALASSSSFANSGQSGNSTSGQLFSPPTSFASPGFQAAGTTNSPASGASGLDKSSRKIVKAKRRR